MHRSLLLLVAIACAPPELALTRSLDQAPLPQSMILSIANPLLPGVLLDALVTGAQPGDTILLVRSNGGLGAGGCPSPLNGDCLDILRGTSGYIVQTTMTADALGQAVYSPIVPATVPLGASVSFQAVVVASGQGSNPVARVVGPSACVDDDLDGYGEGCALGPDCDDDVAQCTTDCADLDGDGLAECSEPLGTDVLLYNGQGGGAYDIYEDDLVDFYAASGVTATISASSDVFTADIYGSMLVLSPRSGFPDASLARAILARGGSVVVAVEHSGYGDSPGATTWMSGLGSTMTSLGGLRAGAQSLSVSPVAGVSDNLTALSTFYCADIDVGSGVAIGVHADGSPGIGWESVGGGDLVLVPDGSFFATT
jgi:hypothetical protein